MLNPYVERVNLNYGVDCYNDWNIKIYSLHTGDWGLSDEYLKLIENYAFNFLPTPAVTDTRYGVGFLIIHHGLMRNWILLNWWENEDILHSKVFSSPLNDPTNFSEEPDKSLLACTHELKIINYESEAWSKAVLISNSLEDIELYLQDIMPD